MENKNVIHELNLLQVIYYIVYKLPKICGYNFQTTKTSELCINLFYKSLAEELLYSTILSKTFQ